jgi:hypothetical protein
MQRRDLMTMTGAALLLAGGRALAQSASTESSAEAKVVRTDGTRRRIGSDLVYREDLTGEGHVTRALSPITNVFLHVPDDFDVVAWAAGR